MENEMTLLATCYFSFHFIQIRMKLCNDLSISEIFLLPVLEWFAGRPMADNLTHPISLLILMTFPRLGLELPQAM